MKQYLKIKSQYKDSILLFRLGDFYEMFFDDAKIASKILQITLTSRDKGKENPIPMCGFPYHSSESYIKKLLASGHRVAICEQLEDPKKAKNIVKRDVVKVLTPATAIEYEDSIENLFVSSIIFEKDQWIISFLDLTTGEIFLKKGEKTEDLRELIYKFSPKEVVIKEDEENPIFFEIKKIFEEIGVLLNFIEEWRFSEEFGEELLKEFFKTKTVESLFPQKDPLFLKLLSGVLYYVKTIRMGSLPELKSIKILNETEYLEMDSSAYRNLEIFKNLKDGKKEGSLFWLLDKTKTSMGTRLLKHFLLYPLKDSKKINERLDAVEELLSSKDTLENIKKKLENVYDLDRISTKISSLTALPRDFVALKNSLNELPELKNILSLFKMPLLKEIYDNIDTLQDVKELIDKAIIDAPPHQITEGGIIKSGYNKELDELREISASGKKKIAELETIEKKRTGISSLKIKFNKVFGFYIEISKAVLKNVKLPDDYIRKQTLVSAERFVSAKLKEYEEKVVGAEEKIKILEYELFKELREKISKEVSRIQKTSSAMALLDVLLSFAEVADERRYKKPLVYEGENIEIIGGRHPVVEVLSEIPFVPNDTFLSSKKEQILIITGPNMGGKSTYLRQTALIVLMAQIGCFVPAESAQIGVVDKMFTRIGASDYLTLGQSTFMVEMIETARILRNSTSKSLVLLDEIGRGTSTYDGLSIAWAVVEYLHSGRNEHPKTLFATHYHQITEIENYLPRVKNYHIGVRETKNGITFLYRISPGPTDKSFGIEVAKLSGIPDEVVKRAKELLISLEKKDIFSFKKIFEKSDEPLLFKDLKKTKTDKKEEKKLKSLKEKIESIEPDTISPKEAHDLLYELKKIVKE